jgi:hypothetical protein
MNTKCWYCERALDTMLPHYAGLGKAHGNVELCYLCFGYLMQLKALLGLREAKSTFIWHKGARRAS